jgi:xanthine dehydrogenase YagS FAD-binding subunit
MRPFEYIRATSTAGAVDEIAHRPNSKFLGGGTNLIDLMREHIEQPDALVDITRLPFSEIREREDGGLSLGAGVRNTAVASHPLVRARYPMLSEAILCGASGQIRNMATVGGNLMQRTRCSYFYDDAAHCNKRQPGAGCDAIEGFNRSHAILGASEACIATHPSDMCVALAALDATVQVSGPQGERTLPFLEFHRLPGDTPHIETVLEPGEVIAAITVPANPATRRSHYLKVRDRASFEFAVVSAAVALQMDGARIRQARVALGGVGTKPWRVPRVEAALAGASLDPAALRPAAALAAEGAQGRGPNDFKIELMQRAIVRAVEIAGART